MAGTADHTQFNVIGGVFVGGGLLGSLWGLPGFAAGVLAGATLGWLVSRSGRSGETLPEEYKYVARVLSATIAQREDLLSTLGEEMGQLRADIAALNQSPPGTPGSLEAAAVYRLAKVARVLGEAVAADVRSFERLVVAAPDSLGHGEFGEPRDWAAGFGRVTAAAEALEEAASRLQRRVEALRSADSAAP